MAWMLKSNQTKRREKILNEMKEDNRFPENVRQWADQGSANLISEHLIREIEVLRPILVEVLEIIANRILPRRDGVWTWRTRQDGQRGHTLATEKRAARNGEIRIFGQRGLSLERLEQIEELRRRCQSLNRSLLHTPGERPRMGRLARGQELPDPCPEILEKMESLREQRVNQTAHLILAEALGVRLRPPAKSPEERRQRDIHGEYELIPGRRPVDFIVLEDLTRYQTGQDRPRRENSRLMKWCHRAILDKIKELCEPYGIPILETPPAYTSRFSSRDGQPGFRAIELTPKHRNKFPWRGDLQRLEEIQEDKKKVDREEKERLVCVRHLFDCLDDINKNREPGKPPRTLIAPLSGGPLFVPMRGPIIQADINAAINLALRAIASPQCHDIHTRVRTTQAQGQLRVRRENTNERFRWEEEYPVVPVDPPAAKTTDTSSRNPNYFYDPAKIAEFGKALINGIEVSSGAGLWKTVNKRAWLVVSRLNNDRLEKWGFPRQFDEEEIPF